MSHIYSLSETDRRHKTDRSFETHRIQEADRRRMPGDVRQEKCRDIEKIMQHFVIKLKL